MMPTLSLSQRIASLRILFGLVWLVDAAFKFEPSFYKNLLTFIMSKDAGEPGWLNPWFHAWYKIIGLSPTFFSIVIIVIEVFFTLSLIFGIARRLNYLIGIPFCFLIWGVGEAFGGPYVAGATDINAGFIYVLVFLFLYTVDALVKPSWSLDPVLSKRFSWWRHFTFPPEPKETQTNPAITKISRPKFNSPKNSR